MKELDKDGDGKLDISEFGEFIRQVLTGTMGGSKELPEETPQEEVKKDPPLPIPEVVPQFTLDTPVIKKDPIIDVPELSAPVAKQSPKQKSSSSSSSSNKSKSKSHSSNSVSSKSMEDSIDKIAKELNLGFGSQDLRNIQADLANMEQKSETKEVNIDKIAKEQNLGFGSADLRNIQADLAKMEEKSEEKKFSPPEKHKPLPQVTIEKPSVKKDPVIDVPKIPVPMVS